MSQDAPTSPAAATRAAFIFIFVTVLLDFLAFGIIAPVLPNLIIQFEAGNISRAASITGIFGFAWATMQFLFSPLLGALSDRFGRRPIILLSCAGLGLDYIFMAMAPSLRWLFVGRLISGITASNISTAFAYVTDVTTAEKRAKQFGLLTAAFGLGFIIGPAVGGLLGSISLRLPFLGCRRAEPDEHGIWIFYPAGIAAARKTFHQGPSHGQPTGFAFAAALTSGA